MSLRFLNLSFFRTKYFNGFAWQTFSTILAQLITLSFYPILTRLYSPTVFGEYSLFVEYLSFTTILLSFRAEHVVILPSSFKDSTAIYRLIVEISPIVGLAFLLPALFFPSVFKFSHISILLLLFVCAYFFSVSSAATQLRQKYRHFRLTGLSEVINKFVYGCCAVLFALFNYLQSSALIFSFTLGFIFKFLVLRFPARTKSNINTSFKKGVNALVNNDLFKLMGSMICSHATLAFTSVLPIAFIANNFGDQYAGYFALVNTTLALPTSIIGKSLNQVFTESAARLFNSGKSFYRLLCQNLVFLSLFALPIVLIIANFAVYIYPFAFGDQWTEAGSVASILVISSAFSFISTPFDRSNLIVNAWYYGPIWHALRLVAVVSLIIYSSRVSLGFYHFLWLFVIQASLLYLLDLLASLYFSRQSKTL